MPPRPASKPPLTHFLCVKLVTPSSRPQLSASLSNFKADVTSPTTFNIPPDAVRPLGSLHLTLGMMSFPGGEGLQNAVDMLSSLKPREIMAGVKPLSARTPLAAASAPTPGASQGSQSLSLTLRGLRSMQNPAQASVLYVPPEDPQGMLQVFCEDLRQVFLEAGLMVKEDRPLLLHATIMNTIYARTGGRKSKGKMTVDARDLLDRYDDYVWMEDVPLEKIAICKMGAKKVDGEDEAAYEVEAEIDF